MAIKYQFKYMPLVGKLPGKSMAEQTETAINEIAQIVNENVAQAEIVNTLAEEAKAQSDEALEKATEALETSGRVYIKETSAVNLNDYCESQLIYIGNVSSTNLPTLSKGFLEVKTNDDKSQATQVFTADGSDTIYVRSGAITAQTVGDVTTYTASYGSWVQIAKRSEIVNTPVSTTETNSTNTAYSVSVPSDKVFANCNKFYGKTWAWNQVMSVPSLTNWQAYNSNIVTISSSNDYVTGTVINTAQSANYYYGLQLQNGVSMIVGHKYYFGYSVKSNVANMTFSSEIGANSSTISGSTPNANTWVRLRKIYTSAITATRFLTYPTGNKSGLVFDLKEPVLIDLTLMFGAGNEPTTVAEFEALFPADYYPYNAGTLISASISNVKSKDSSNNAIANMPIPSAIQSLPCYGASAGSVKNYIDFERKVYVQNVGGVDLGTLTWTQGTTITSGKYRWSSEGIASLAKPAADAYTIPNIICSKYPATLASATFENTDVNGISLRHEVANVFLYDTVLSTSTVTADQVKSALSGVMLYYELQTPIEHDISDILGVCGIACEENGTLTFENSNGSDYQLPIQYDLDFVEGTDGLMTVQDKEKLEVAYETSKNLDPFDSVGRTLGKIYTTSKDVAVSANTITELSRIDNHPKGTFLIITNVDAPNTSFDNLYISYIYIGASNAGYVRNNGSGGGGCINCVIVSINKDVPVICKTYVASNSVTMRGRLTMIQLSN